MIAAGNWARMSLAALIFQPSTPSDIWIKAFRLQVSGELSHGGGRCSAVTERGPYHTGHGVSFGIFWWRGFRRLRPVRNRAGLWICCPIVQSWVARKLWRRSAHMSKRIRLRCGGGQKDALCLAGTGYFMIFFAAHLSIAAVSSRYGYMLVCIHAKRSCGLYSFADGCSMHLLHPITHVHFH